MGAMEQENMREDMFYRVSDIIDSGNLPLPRMKQYRAWDIAESMIIRCGKCRWYDERTHICYYHQKEMAYYDFCSRGREINVEID